MPGCGATDGGGKLAVDHLLACGRTRIGHISGDPSYGAARDRARGAIDRLGRAGLELAGGQVFFGAWSEAWGRNATRELLRRASDVDEISGLGPDRPRGAGHARLRIERRGSVFGLVKRRHR